MPRNKQNPTILARAKINLTLHVGTARADGYHPLHSLVVFADIGDALSAMPASEFSLKMTGPFANGLSQNGDNLVLTAARKITSSYNLPTRLAYTLAKNLPISSGIGGGSADAAAAIHLLEQVNEDRIDNLLPILLKIGADVPVCYRSETCLMQGIGEDLTPLKNMGQAPAVLINPGVAVSTAEIFKTFDKNRCSSEFTLQGETLLEMAQSGTNDLQTIAIQIAPEIQAVLGEINIQDGCQLARMSGSGATCFGVFANLDQAKKAVRSIKEKHPHWWCVPTMLGDRP